MKPKGILFMGVANSARSQMAEGWARALLGERVPIYSAGSEPSRVNPRALEAMPAVGVDLHGHTSKGVADIPVEAIDVIVTLCAREVCPVFPGQVERHHWPHPDPAAVVGTEADEQAAFAAVRDQLRARLQSWFQELGLLP